MNLQNLLHAVDEQQLHILNIVIRQNGEIIAEHNFVDERRALLYSVSKTFTSMAVGIAEAEGYFHIGDPLSDYFRTPTDPLWAQMTIRDLLRMGVGQRKDPLSTALDAGQPLDNVEKLFFDEMLIDPPGSHFHYNNAATYMLSKLISLRTGLCLNDYLRPRIFEPLGILNVYWEADVNGVNFGCSGLRLNAHELSKFGQLLLDEGMMGSTRLIPREYIRAATTKQIDNTDFNAYFATTDHRVGYGFQIWLNRIPNSYRLDGYKGQYAVVIPEKQAVITFISDEPTKSTNILELIWDYLLEQL